MLALPLIRIFTSIKDPRWQSPIDGVADLFCPVMHDLPEQHAALLALLPIHDANGVLLAELERAGTWHEHGWACVFASDPFRTPLDLVTALRNRNVSRIACYPTPALFGSTMATTLDLFDLGLKAMANLADVAGSLGMKFATFDEAEHRARPGPNGSQHQLEAP